MCFYPCLTTTVSLSNILEQFSTLSPSSILLTSSSTTKNEANISSTKDQKHSALILIASTNLPPITNTKNRSEAANKHSYSTLSSNRLYIVTTYYYQQQTHFIFWYLYAVSINYHNRAEQYSLSTSDNNLPLSVFPVYDYPTSLFVKQTEE